MGRSDATGNKGARKEGYLARFCKLKEWRGGRIAGITRQGRIER